MDSTELFKQVCTHPDDDQRRLDYAAYMQQYRPEKAEFIRLQVARAVTEREQKARQRRLGPRERELLAKHGSEWAHYVEPFVRPSRIDPTDCGWDFDRGFLAFARMEPENFVALGPRLFEMAPIQHADLTGGDDPVRPLFQCQLLSRLDSLSLANTGLDDDDAISLAGCTALRRCTWLDLTGNKISTRGVEALARSPMMANKVIVMMDGNPCNPVDQAHYDWDGSIADSTPSPIGVALEAKLGRVEWFHLKWGRINTMPDRYNAKWLAADTVK